MKKSILVIIAMLFSILVVNILHAVADTWTRKADFGGTPLALAPSFSIGSKGYIGKGPYPDSQEFWEYDPAANTWTQKADFGGTWRELAVCFSIGNKGYIGTGSMGASFKKDFWEYDPAANTWTQKADFGGTGRSYAVGFTIGNKGYIGTGLSGDLMYHKDFWEYDPAANTWAQKADFGGTARGYAVGFSIGSKGYIGTGYDGSFYKDFWEYTGNTAEGDLDHDSDVDGSDIAMLIANPGLLDITIFAESFGRTSGQ